MIVGTGQLAYTFKEYDIDDIVFFASGVANSNCIDNNEFEREKKLLLSILKTNTNKSFIYFSSCALSVSEYSKNSYYQHKIDMENIIKENSTNYYIFRLPQLFGDLKKHSTLINFIYNSILHNKKLNIYDKAYRYVIEINDVKALVLGYLKYSQPCVTVDIANPYRYKVTDIVKVIEKILNKKADIELKDMKDGYILNTLEMESFIKKNLIKVFFSKDYLYEKLKEKYKEI